ncbi:phage protein [Streptococcus pneumoniae]|nr:phage protein [Streptococcus pneumoniae]
MAINNYELASKPYTRGFGNNIATVVEIRLSEGNRYSTNMRELVGDRTSEPEDVLIQDVLDILKSELDPGSAIVKTQAKLQETEQKLAETEQKATQVEAKQNDLEALANRINKVVRVMAQDSIMGEKVAYGTTYKEMVELFPLAEVGKVYEPGAIFAVEDPNHAEINGEGKRILIQTNQSFTYQGETLAQLEGTPYQNGVLTPWKFNAPKAPNEQ